MSEVKREACGITVKEINLEPYYDKCLSTDKSGLRRVKTKWGFIERTHISSPNVFCDEELPELRWYAINEHGWSGDISYEGIDTKPEELTCSPFEVYNDGMDWLTLVLWEENGNWVYEPSHLAQGNLLHTVTFHRAHTGNKEVDLAHFIKNDGPLFDKNLAKWIEFIREADAKIAAYYDVAEVSA